MKTHMQIVSDIDALKRAVESLRSEGHQILSARVHCHQQPEIHVREPFVLHAFDGLYLKFESAGYRHWGAQHLGCEIVWVTPQPLPGYPPQHFHPQEERTAHHG